jgi:glycosyltransferase involved in cell wall biosynthesis
MEIKNRPKGLPNNPFVSVVTPTFNRRRFIPYLIECYKSQTYPKDKMEWIIYDDGTDPVGDLFKDLNLPNIKYIYEEEKQNIGAKRNRLNKEAKGPIIVAMDDDDFYFPDRVSHAVFMLRGAPGIELAGSSEIYLYYTDNKIIYKLGPYHKNHATNGTMAWLKSYANIHFYDETVTHAEEKSFLDNYKNRMIQLNPMKVMLVISHTENTFDKKKLREQEGVKSENGQLINPFIKKTNIKIKDLIRNLNLREFYSSA